MAASVHLWSLGIDANTRSVTREASEEQTIGGAKNAGNLSVLPESNLSRLRCGSRYLAAHIHL